MKVIDIDRDRLIRHDRAMNASVVIHEGKRIMAYRVENHKLDSWAKLAICELDEDWQPIQDTNRLLSIDSPSSHTNLFEDPRLFVSYGKLFMSYIAATVGPVGHVACQGLCGIIQGGNGFRAEPATVYPPFGHNHNYAYNGSGDMKGEKNWTFLYHASDAVCLYALNPLTVFRMDMPTGKCTGISSTLAVVEWPYGNLSGSTPLIEWNGKLLGMFHSFVHDDKKRRHYYAGWYMIDPTTWKIVALSKEPVLSAGDDINLDLRPLNQVWRPNVVFPCGLVDLGSGVLVSYGWQDARIKLAFIDKSDIELNIKPVKSHYVRKEIINDPWRMIPGGFDCTINGRNFHSRTWPSLVRQAWSHGISEDQLHQALLPRVPKHRRRLEWVLDL